MQLFLSLLLLSLLSLIQGSDDDFYFAAAIQASPLPLKSNDTMKLFLTKSLDRVADLTKEAMESSPQRPDILVFPEALLWSPAGSRERMGEICESVPFVDNGHPKIFPCENEDFAESPVLQRISCLARQYRVTIVLNLATAVACNQTNDAKCPSDGHYQYNTDIAVSDAGQLMARYHKHHIFGTSPMIDEAPREVAVFDTSFGVKFGMFICFDIEFGEPARGLFAQGVRNIAFSTFWYNTPPLMTATMVQQGWSRVFASNIIAANTNTNMVSSGAGMFSGGESVAFYFNSTQAHSAESILYGRLPKQIEPVVDLPPSSEVAKEVPPAETQVVKCGSPQQPSSCAVFDVKVGQPVSIVATSEFVECTAVVNASFTTSGSARYALMAQAGDFRFPSTVDTLATAACSIVHCSSSSIECPFSFAATAGFESFEVKAVAKRRKLDPIAFPMVSIENNAQPVPVNSIGFSTKTNTNDDTLEMKVWSTSKWNSSAPLFAAGTIANVLPLE